MESHKVKINISDTFEQQFRSTKLIVLDCFSFMHVFSVTHTKVVQIGWEIVILLLLWV